MRTRDNGVAKSGPPRPDPGNPLLNTACVEMFAVDLVSRIILFGESISSRKI